MSQTLSALVVMALFLPLPAGGQQPDGRCHAGIWDLGTTNAGAGAKTLATSTRYCLFEGSVEVAEYRSFGPAGQMNFAGISFHAWNPDRTGLTTLWLMIGDSGYTIIPTTLSDGSLVASGWGKDASGSFLERSRTSFPSEGHYHFVMERSHDDGASWQPGSDIEGVFRTAEIPPHPRTLRDQFLAIRGSAPPTKSMIVLDGLAELQAEEVGEDGNRVRLIHFSSAYGPPPGIWRTVTWRVGSTSITTEP